MVIQLDGRIFRNGILASALFAAVKSPTSVYELANKSLFLLTPLMAVGIIYIIFACYIFTIWEEKFSGTRLSRYSEQSPSNKQPPDVKSWKQNRERTLHNSKLHENFDTCELLNDLADLEVTKKENQLIRKRMNERSPLIPIPGKKTLAPLSETGKAKDLDMDHVHIQFFQFLWGCTFIGPCSYLLWKKGVTWLSIRQFLVKRGILKVKPFDIDEVIGKLCLEQTQAIHYYAKTKVGSKLGNIAGFFFADFPYIDNNCEYKVADLFSVDINLDTKKFVKAKFDDVHLTASETLILLWFNTIGAQHVKLHALANWGFNSDTAVKETNPFLYRNSIVTSIYNYFGYSCFSTYMEEWERQGLLAVGFDPNAWTQCIDHGIKAHIWQHSNIDELVKYSRFVRFIVQVRAIFSAEFGKHKDVFPGVQGEAMFVGTVLHSLDHTLMNWNLEDPLWLDVDDPRFGRMAQIGRIVKVGFVQDVPLLYFHKRFKGSGHPFYEAVYKKAAKINKELADNMDTCIIK